MTIRPVLVGMLMCGAAIRSAGDTTPSLLTDIRYDVLERTSRLTLRVSGPIRYTVQGSGQAVTLRFARTGIGTPPGPGRRVYGSGDVSALTIDRLPGDSLQLRVVLRNTDRYTLAQPSTGGVLVMEIPAASPRKSPPPPARTRKEERTEARGPSASPLDIQSVIRAQMSGPGAEAARTAPAEPANGIQGGSEQPVSYGLVMTLIACLVAGGTTALSLFLLRRFLYAPGELLPAVQRTPAIAVRPDAHDVGGERHIVDQGHGFGIAAGDEDEIPGEPEIMEPFDAVAELAERFRRGYDEVGLAVRLHGTKPSPLNGEAMAKAAGKGGRTARMNAARRLGVGHGEVNLALHLKEFEHRNRGEQQ